MAPPTVTPPKTNDSATLSASGKTASRVLPTENLFRGSREIASSRPGSSGFGHGDEERGTETELLVDEEDRQALRLSLLSSEEFDQEALALDRLVEGTVVSSTWGVEAAEPLIQSDNPPSQVYRDPLQAFEDWKVRMAILESSQADLPTDIYEEQELAMQDELFSLNTGFKPAAEASRFGNTGATLLQQAITTHDLDALGRSVAALRTAVYLTPDGHPGKPVYLNNLGGAFQCRFERTGRVADLEQAIAMMSRAIGLIPDGHPDKPASFNNLGGALLRRFEHVGELDDLERAITMMCRADGLSPDGHPNKPNSLFNLGIALQNRFDRAGALCDLEQAITKMRLAIELIPDDHPDKSASLNNLGGALLRRFEHVGELDDLERAITVMDHGIELTQDSHPNKPGCLSSLVHALFRRFERLGELNDLDQAITRAGHAIELTPDGHPDKPGYFSHLGSALSRRFEHVGELDDLERAIVQVDHATELTPDSHPGKPGRLSNLGNALKNRFDRVGELDDLERAIVSMGRAVKLTPDGHPGKPGHLSNLGNVLLLRFERVGDLGDLEAAFQSYRMAADHTLGPPHLRLRSLEHCAITCRTQIELGCTTHQTLFNVYDHGFSLIPQVAWLGNSIKQRYEFLSQIGEMVNDAVSVAIEVGQHERAVEWLDQGRGIVWSQLTQLRSPVDELEGRHPALAEKLCLISRALESSWSSAGVDPTFSSAFSPISRDNILRDESSTRIELAQTYEALLAQIRGLEGFDRFLMPKTLVELRSASKEGPIILLNVHASRCDALVVCQSMDDVIHVPLPELSEDLAKAMRSQLFNSLRHASVRGRVSDQRGVPSKQPPAGGGIYAALGCLWSQVVQPILQSIETELFENAGNSLPHVTWCPTGPLSFLPLHAAGIYDSQDGIKVFELVVSSYTTTISALLQRPTPRQPDLHSPAQRILVVSQPGTPGIDELPGTKAEVFNIKKHFTDDAILHLDHSHATADAVLRAMREQSFDFVHLACHGRQDADDPSKSAFILHGRSLLLSDIMKLSTENASLAFLSACQTATGDLKLTEEAVHLTAGMLVAGYKAVIGTMWSIYDEDAPLVADEVYGRLLKDQDRNEVDGARSKTAYALHAAVEVLRDRVGESNFMRWVPFVHFGI